MNNVMFAGMLGGWEVLLLLLVVFVSVVFLVVRLVMRLARRWLSPKPSQPHSQVPPKPSLTVPPTPSTCPRCGTPLPADSPQGLCPRCVLGVGLATQTEATGEFGPHGTRVTKPPPSPAEIARNFSQLEILDCLGRGGMGVVYKARQPKLNRLVALKILAPEKGADPKFAERFLREAQALARLSHPNIVTVHDFGEADGMFYLLMEYVDGATLRQLLREGRMKPETALTIVPKICEALQFAHEQGVVHRDIKPENVLLDKQGRVKIADFGIAKLMAERGTPGRSGADVSSASEQSQTSTAKGSAAAGTAALRALTQDQVLGTPHYMAPEQVEHPQTVDHRADIYSLGVVFYEMLTGELPLGKFQPPSKKVQVDVRLDEVVLHALEKEPERRYQHVSEVKSAVDTIATTPSLGGSGRESAPIEDRSQRAVAAARSNAKEATMVFAGTFFFAFLLAVVAELSRSSVVPLKEFLIVLCIVGLVICALSLAGFWPFPSPWFPEPNFSSRNLRRWKLTGPEQTNNPPDENESALAKARQEVKNPASWLVATGILNWIAIPFIVMVILPIATRAGGRAGPIIFVLIAALFLSSAIILAGLKMKRLEAYSLAVMGSLLAIFITPGNIIGLPVGIWCLVTLFRRDVREAFQKNNRPEILPPRPAGTWPQAFWRIAGGFILLVVVNLALLETIEQLTVHERESTGELWSMALMLASIAGLVWVFWPRYRLKYSWLVLVGGTVVSFFVLLGLDNFYAWHLRPNLGLYREPDWVAQHPGFQRQLRQRIENNLWRKNAATPATAQAFQGGQKNPVQLDSQGQPIATHVMQIWSKQPSATNSVIVALEGRVYTNLDHVVARIGELMPQKPFPFIRVHVGPPAWGRADGQKFVEELGARCRKIGFINLSFKYDLTEAPEVASLDGAVFGPVIKWVLQGDEAIDLDSNRLVKSLPTELYEKKFPIEKGGIIKNVVAAFACMRQERLDMFYSAQDGFFGSDMKLKKLKAGDWGTFNAASLIKITGLSDRNTPAQMSLKVETNGPTVYAFTTREGGMGLLQITCFTDNPRGVRIRYKLVQPAAGGSAASKAKATTDQVIVEDLALQMLAAIRDKDDATLKSLATDSVKPGWRDAVPQFAAEMRERFAQLTGKSFAMIVAESLVEADRAVVKCTGPKELGGTYLVLFFVKTGDGWRNWSLRNSPPGTPLNQDLKQKPSMVQAAEAKPTSVPSPTPANTNEAQAGYDLVQAETKPANLSESSVGQSSLPAKLLSTGEFSQDFQMTLPLTSKGRFSLDNPNGTVEITGWDRNEVSIKGIKRGKNREAVEATKTDVESRADQVAVHTRVPRKLIGWGNENVTVDYTIRVPRTARLEKIENANGNVVIEDVTGDIAASTANGSVRAKGSAGDLKLSTSNGQITAEPASLNGNQSVSLDVANGSITVTLPANVEATVTADTTNGSITSEFSSLTVKKDFPTGSHLKGTLGKGGASVNAQTVNGRVTIRRGKEMK